MLASNDMMVKHAQESTPPSCVVDDSNVVPFAHISVQYKWL